MTRFPFLILAALLALSGCAVAPPTPVIPPSVPPPSTPPPPTSATSTTVLTPMPWSALPDWSGNDALQAWQAFLTSCGPLAKQSEWRPVCQAATQETPQDDAAARAFFERWLTPHQVGTSDGADTGLITGYYEPLLYGSRTRSERYRFPLYGLPDDLLIVDLSGVYPELKSYRLRGRLAGNRVVPYYSRADIEAGRAPLENKVLYWVDDAVSLFFLQIQGSGRVQLESGEVARVGYADQNGHPYVSIGKKLVERGELSLDQASMQGIKTWGARNPEKLPELLNTNASYVFFRELPPSPNGPPGALGVPLSAERSLAVDPRAVPLGAPVFLSTTYPNGSQPLNRLMLAQDTGGAIKGSIRADFFWGFGEAAGKQAGAMRQQGKMWVLLPNTGTKKTE